MAGAVRSPIARGAMVAMAAALLFGATAPIVKHYGRDVGPFATAALLYTGTTLGAGAPRKRADEAPVRREHARRLMAVALVGAALAPACLAWGLQRTGALASSLLLNLEAIFTVLLARAFYREPVGGRVVLASALMLGGGGLLAFRSVDGNQDAVAGIIAVSIATLGWALDNTLTRPLADLDPRAVVFWKGLLGTAFSGVIALVAGEQWPMLGAACVLVLCGAAGYGVSLRLYLGAQRVLGAARTGSLFSLAPFTGAAIALVLGDRERLLLVASAGALFGLGAWLHVTERHGHRHVHEFLVHEHAHRHDDGHHEHAHDPPFTGEHSHRHEHTPVVHDHPHGVDLHHRHEHDTRGRSHRS